MGYVGMIITQCDGCGHMQTLSNGTFFSVAISGVPVMDDRGVLIPLDIERHYCPVCAQKALYDMLPDWYVDARGWSR